MALASPKTPGKSRALGRLAFYHNKQALDILNVRGADLNEKVGASGVRV